MDLENPGFHLFFTNEITLYGYEFAGTSGDIPGDQVDSGTPISGVAIDVTSGMSYRAEMLTAIHELGHFVGLFHTSELSGDDNDPLDDTEECADIRDSDSCIDRSNVMFPVLTSDWQTLEFTTTPQQRRVVQASLIYRDSRESSYFRRSMATNPTESWSYTRSGRELSELETMLAAALCPHHSRVDAELILARWGRVEGGRLLSEIADDPDVIPLIRRNARALSLDLSLLP